MEISAKYILIFVSNNYPILLISLMAVTDGQLDWRFKFAVFVVTMMWAVYKLFREVFQKDRISALEKRITELENKLEETLNKK